MNVEPACLTSFHARAALMGFAFTIIAAGDGSGVPPELYGNVVYTIPAIAWGSTQATLGTLCAIFIVLKWMRLLAVFSGLHALYYCGMGTLALRAEMGTLVAIGAIAIMLPPCISTFLFATRQIGEADG